MATPSPHNSTVKGETYEGEWQAWSGLNVRGGGQSPSPANARQAQRRYRSLFQKAAKEYKAWCDGEDDSQRALGSVFHLLDRLQMLDPDEQTDDKVNLGGLQHLPGCRTLLIRKHTMELERVMRLWRALVQQMRGQVSRVEESLAEAWQLHRSEARARTPPPTPSWSPQPAVQHLQGHASYAVGRLPPDPSSARHSRLEAEKAMSPAATVSRAGRSGPDDVRFSGEAASQGSVSGEVQRIWRGGRGSDQMMGSPTASVRRWTSTVGPAEHLQWLGDMSNMLLHEQWRKEELLAHVDFGPETSSARVRNHVQARWSSRSEESFLDRMLIDTALSAAQVAPFSRAH